MFDLNSDDCAPECLPFEESLDKEKAEEYLEYIENLRYNSINFENNNDEYSSGEEIPDCNPWRD